MSEEQIVTEEAQAESFLDRMRGMGDIIDEAKAPSPAPSPPAEEPQDKDADERPPLDKIDSMEGDEPSKATPLDRLKSDGGGGSDSDADGKGVEDSGDGSEEESEPASESPTPAGHRFKQLKGENKTLKATISEVESERDGLSHKIAEMESQLTEYESMREDMERFKQERSVLQLEQTDQFQSEITEPLKKIMSEAYKIGDSYAEDGLKDTMISDALGMEDRRARNKALRELQEKYDMDPEDKDTLVELGAQIIPLMNRRQELFSDAERALLEIKETQSQRQAQELASEVEERKIVADRVTQKFRTRVPFLSEIVDLDQVRQKAAETPFSNLDTTEQLYYQMAGESFPELAQAYVKLQEAFDDLSDELTGLKGGEPSAGPSSGSSAPDSRVGPNGEPVSDRGSFLDRLKDGRMFGGT